MPTSTGRTPLVPPSSQGAGANRKNLAAEEPEGHAFGRSRGGLGSKVHAVVDSNGMPLAIMLTGGQRYDGAILIEVLDDIRVHRAGSGRPRSRPAAVGRPCPGCGIFLHRSPTEENVMARNTSACDPLLGCRAAVPPCSIAVGWRCPHRHVGRIHP